MGRPMPSLTAVTREVTRYGDDVRAALAEPDWRPGSAVASALHAEAVGLVAEFEHLRDATLALARRSATWQLLEADSDVPDSTLRDRLTRYEIEERNR